MSDEHTPSATGNLSRTDREYLSHLRFREAGGEGRPCWVYRQPRNRWALLVWTLMGTWSRTPQWTKNGRTLASLEARGLIEYGPDGYLPVPFQTEYGSEIRLTAAGRRAIGDDDA